MANLIPGKIKNSEFVHIPKTGGLAILKTFGIENCAGHGKYFKKSNLHSFTFVRNPYDRLVSAYFYICNAKEHKQTYIDLIKPHQNFEGFLRAMRQDRFAFFNCGCAHFKPQAYWIFNKNNIQVDSIFRFEHFDESINKIHLMLNGESYNKPIEFVNTSEHKPYKDYYTEELKNIVYNIYKIDFDLFNYKK